jgi:hypothetical protein
MAAYFRLGRLTRKKAICPSPAGKQGVAFQAGDFALLDIAKLDGDDLIFCLADWACERNRF